MKNLKQMNTNIFKIKTRRLQNEHIKITENEMKNA